MTDRIDKAIEALEEAIEHHCFHDTPWHTQLVEALALLRQPSPTITKFCFDRYRRNGRLAEGVCVHATTAEEAYSKAKRLYAAYGDCKHDEYVLCEEITPTMMPDAHVVEEMVKAYYGAAKTSRRKTNIECMEHALSCDAFRNWLGGVGEQCLPELPSGWQINAHGWEVQIDEIDCDNCIIANGPTPRAAVLAALANIKTEG